MGLASAFMSGLLFGVSDVYVRLASTGLSPRKNLLISLLVGSPLLWAAALAFGGEPPSSEASLVYVAAGILNFGVGRLLFYLAIAYSGVATASVLTSPTIIVASLLAWALLGEPLTPRLAIALVLVVGGVYLARAKPSGEPLHGGTHLVGVLAGLSSTLAFAGSSVLVRYAGGSLGGSPMYGVAISYTSAIPLALPLALRDGGGWSLRHVRAMALGAALVALAQLSRYVALSLLPVAVASVLIALFPVHTVVFARLMAREIRERVEGVHALGALLSFAGVAIAIA